MSPIKSKKAKNKFSVTQNFFFLSILTHVYYGSFRAAWPILPLNRLFLGITQVTLEGIIDLKAVKAIDNIVAIHLSGASHHGSPWRSFGHSKNRLGPCIPRELCNTASPMTKKELQPIYKPTHTIRITCNIILICRDSCWRITNQTFIEPTRCLPHRPQNAQQLPGHRMTRVAGS